MDSLSYSHSGNSRNNSTYSGSVNSARTNFSVSYKKFSPEQRNAIEGSVKQKALQQFGAKIIALGDKLENAQNNYANALTRDQGKGQQSKYDLMARGNARWQRTAPVSKENAEKALQENAKELWIALSGKNELPENSSDDANTEFVNEGNSSVASNESFEFSAASDDSSISSSRTHEDNQSTSVVIEWDQGILEDYNQRRPSKAAEKPA